MKRVKKLNNLPDDTVYDVMNSPVGRLTIFASAQGIHTILWENETDINIEKTIASRYQQNSQHDIILTTKQQLTEYFSGERQAFKLPLCLDGTPFQLQAWRQLCQIPYGQTISYAQQAARLGDSNKARAVGLANGLNPIPIIVPCHRVIGSNGQLTGFASGLDNKARLLQLEQDGHD